MCFYFGKNAPLIWHPLGSSDDCVAAMGLCVFRCVVPLWGYTLFIYERRISMECKECQHTLSDQEIQVNLCFECGAILDPSLLAEEVPNPKSQSANGDGNHVSSIPTNVRIANEIPVVKAPVAENSSLFSNSANKLKLVAKVLFVLCCIVSFIVGIAIWDDWGLLWLYSIIIWVVGPTVAYIQGLLLYTFAQMAEDISVMRKSSKK